MEAELIGKLFLSLSAEKDREITLRAMLNLQASLLQNHQNRSVFMDIQIIVVNLGSHVLVPFTKYHEIRDIS